MDARPGRHLEVARAVVVAAGVVHEPVNRLGAETFRAQPLLHGDGAEGEQRRIARGELERRRKGAPPVASPRSMKREHARLEALPLVQLRAAPPRERRETLLPGPIAIQALLGRGAERALVVSGR